MVLVLPRCFHNGVIYFYLVMFLASRRQMIPTLTEQQFIQAIESHQGVLHKVCNLYMQPGSDREDLFQEILLNAWKGVRNFKGDAKFSTWLYRVALNTAITFYRKDQRQPVLAEWTPALSLPESSPDTAQEEVNALYQAIGELSGIDKALVMLYLEEYSYAEIGDIMGITPNNVAVKMNRIKTKLRDSSKKYL
jgi:RNA polymerase sigma-70 factor (ECF subfamily)